MNEQEAIADAETFWSKHKKTLTLLIIGLLLAFGGFAVGRFTTTPKVETKIETKTVVQTQVQYKDRIVTQKVYVQAEQKHTHTVTTTVKKPDGTQTTQTTTDVNLDEHAQSNSTTDAQHQQTITQVVTQTVFKDKLVLKQPDWRVYAGVGIALPTYLGQSQIGIPGLNGFVIQAGADRRIIGPFWLGIWGNTQGTVGLNLSATL